MRELNSCVSLNSFSKAHCLDTHSSRHKAKTKGTMGLRRLQVQGESQVSARTQDLDGKSYNAIKWMMILCTTMKPNITVQPVREGPLWWLSSKWPMGKEAYYSRLATSVARSTVEQHCQGVVAQAPLVTLSRNTGPLGGTVRRASSPCPSGLGH